MREPIFRPGSELAKQVADTADPELKQWARDYKLLGRAIDLSIESALRFGKDLPVGAVAAKGGWIVGRYYASDHRTGFRQLHAEVMALYDARFDIMGGSIHELYGRADTVAVTVEPCEACQDTLAAAGLRRVVFGLSRAQVAEKGLVKPHTEDIFERAERIDLPYEIVHLLEPDTTRVASTVLDFVRRNTETGRVQVDQDGLRAVLTA